MAPDRESWAGGRWTASRFKSFIRGALREAYIRWPVKQDCLEAARRDSQRGDARSKYEYQCNSCGEWFMRKDVEVDHVKDAGEIDDLNGFVSRLFCEVDGLQILCVGCHRAKTLAQRAIASKNKKQDSPRGSRE